MSEARHTPGPWLIGFGGNEGDDYAVITSPHYGRAICNLEPRDYRLPNALLIHAAPDLLKALEMALAWHECETESDEWVSVARDAIQKAKGAQ